MTEEVNKEKSARKDQRGVALIIIAILALQGLLAGGLGVSGYLNYQDKINTSGGEAMSDFRATGGITVTDIIPNNVFDIMVRGSARIERFNEGATFIDYLNGQGPIVYGNQTLTQIADQEMQRIKVRLESGDGGKRCQVTSLADRDTPPLPGLTRRVVFVCN